MYPDSGEQLTYETDTAVYWFSSAFDPLNNWSAHAVRIWGKTFPTAEHAYHWRKFSDGLPAVADEILAAPSPWAAMQVERTYRSERQHNWNDVKAAIMTEILRAKLAQNQDVRDCLIKTGTKQLIENSPWDSFWGVGKNGDGQNQMGKILMELRKELAPRKL